MLARLLRYLTLAALLVAALAFGACGRSSDMGIELAIARDLRAGTVWIEVGAFPGASCQALTLMLEGGIPDGADARIAFKPEDNKVPKMGDIPSGPHAFGVVGRGETCEVLFVGCGEANVGKDDRVRVPTRAAAGKGACRPGSVCDTGRCIPANDNADPSIGAGCSLELLGAGPLPSPLPGGQSFVSAPVIAPVAGGFVVAYREVDPGGGNARVTVQIVDPAGGALPPAIFPLPGRCTTSEESDGIGLVMNGGDGLLTSARSACDGGEAQLELLRFALNGDQAQASGPLLATPAGPGPLLFSPVRSAAKRGSAGIAAFVQEGEAIVATIDPSAGITPPSGTFGGSPPMTGAWVATSNELLALLSVGTGPTGPDVNAPPPVDAGADGGTDAGEPTPTPTPDIEGSSMRLLMLPASQSLDLLNGAQALPRRPIVFPGTWASLAVIGKRVIVLSDASEEGVGRTATYRAFDDGNDLPASENGVAAEGTGDATAGDVAIQGDLAFFAVLKPGAITLSAFEGAATRLNEKRVVSFASEPRIPAVVGVRDGRVALTANENGRVAVVWTTATELGADDSTGGYAVFACKP